MKVSATFRHRPAGWTGLVLLLLLLLAAGGRPAGAQPIADDTDQGGEPGSALEVVVVTATRRAVSAREAPAAISVVGEEALLRGGATVLPEALRSSPGAFFQQTTPGQGTPIVRGLRGSQVLHLVDGMRLNNAFFRDAPNQYFALVDPLLVKRIEVLRGAAGSLYGSDAMGGVVAVHSRLPRPGAEGGAARPPYRLFGRWDSADQGWAGRAETFQGGDRVAWRGGVSWQERGDRRVGGGERVRPTAWKSRAADLAIAVDAAGGEWLVQAQGLEQPATPRVDELVPGFGQDQPAASQYLFEPNRRTFLHARYRRETDHPWWRELSIDLARQVVTDDRRIQGFEDQVVETEQNESTLDGLSVQVGASPAPGWSLVWGAEFYRDEVRSARQLQTGAGDPVVSVRGRFPDRSTMDSDALYASAEWRGAERWGLEGGLRYSRFDVFLPADATGPGTRLTPDDLSGDLRLRLDVASGLQLLANVGRGFRTPNIFDLGALGPRPGNRFNVANPNLGPERVWSYDVGLRAWSDGWALEVIAFRLDYRDRIASVPTGEITPGGRVVVRSENRAEARIDGLEATFTWKLAESLELAAVLNATRGEETDAAGVDTPGDRIPPLNGRLAVNWSPAPDWNVEPFLLFADRQDRLSPRDVADPRIDPAGTAGWVTMNVTVAWQATPGLSLGLRLENLGDVAYREHGSGIDAPGRNLGLWAETVF